MKRSEDMVRFIDRLKRGGFEVLLQFKGQDLLSALSNGAKFTIDLAERKVHVEKSPKTSVVQTLSRGVYTHRMMSNVEPIFMVFSNLQANQYYTALYFNNIHGHFYGEFDKEHPSIGTQLNGRNCGIRYSK